MQNPAVTPPRMPRAVTTAVAALAVALSVALSLAVPRVFSRDAPAPARIGTIDTAGQQWQADLETSSAGTNGAIAVSVVLANTTDGVQNLTFENSKQLDVTVTDDEGNVIWHNEDGNAISLSRSVGPHGDAGYVVTWSGDASPGTYTVTVDVLAREFKDHEPLTTTIDIP